MWPGSAYAAVYRVLVGLGMEAELKRLAAPALFLAGRVDPLPPTGDDRAARASGARFSFQGYR